MAKKQKVDVETGEVGFSVVGYRSAGRYIPRVMESRKRMEIKPHPDRGYAFTEDELYPSEKVVPNKALSVREVIDRFTRGLPVDGAPPRGHFPDEVSHDSPDIDELGRMDRTDKLDVARSAHVKFKPPKEEPPKEEPPKEEPPK